MSGTEGPPRPSKTTSEKATSTLPHMEQGEALAGGVRNPDGTWDLSRAVILKASNQEAPEAEKLPDVKKSAVLNPVEKQNFLSVLSTGRDYEKDRVLRWKAKEKGVAPEQLLQEMREYANSKIQSPEKVNYYHRTSIKNFQHIAQMGALLSRSEVKRRNPSVELSAWSSSDNVMMTKDTFDSEGAIISRGLSEHGVGASGGGVTLVLGPRIHQLENFDAISPYPTISDAPLNEVLAAVLVDSEANVSSIKQLLADNNLAGIPVVLQKDWEKSHYASEQRN
ncbi:MAG TPA: hypothetical protein VJH94_02290 [Candidatus Paceibacterota bacterium]